MWIKLTERQPEYLEDVLFLWESGDIFSGWLWGDEGCSPDVLVFGRFKTDKMPTHWRNRPENPNAELTGRPTDNEPNKGNEHG